MVESPSLKISRKNQDVALGDTILGCWWWHWRSPPIFRIWDFQSPAFQCLFMIIFIIFLMRGPELRCGLTKAETSWRLWRPQKTQNPHLPGHLQKPQKDTEKCKKRFLKVQDHRAPPGAPPSCFFLGWESSNILSGKVKKCSAGWESLLWVDGADKSGLGRL